MPRRNPKRYPHQPFGGKKAKATLFIPPPLTAGRLVYTARPAELVVAQGGGARRSTNATARTTR